MQPSDASWNEEQWAAIAAVFPGFLMDWIYGQDGEFRLKHHSWMVTRPSFRLFARELHQYAIAEDADIVITSVTSAAEFPKGEQAKLATSFFRRLGQPDAEETTIFLVAAACELIGATGFNAYKERELAVWIEKTKNENIPTSSYGTVYNLYYNVVIQVVLWIVGCMPFAMLNKRAAPVLGADVVISTSGYVIDSDHRRAALADHDLKKLRTYCDAIYENMRRVSKDNKPTGRTYREFEE